MGNVSWLLKMMNCPHNCKIHWDRMDTTKLFESYFMQTVYEKTENRPQNLAEMAQLWDDTKFYGYLDNNYIISLKEFCKGLEAYDTFPRLYYEHEGWFEIICFEFCPGTETIRIGICDFDEEFEKAGPPVYENYTEQQEEEYEKQYQQVKNAVIEQMYITGVWKWHTLEIDTRSETEQLVAFLHKLKATL